MKDKMKQRITDHPMEISLILCVKLYIQIYSGPVISRRYTELS